jgi:uncharacterized membrane protein YeaQ/YmgE (transglycosylase-associated protein family)
MFHVIAQISFGLAAGVIAELIKPGRNSGGIFAAAGVGLVGSLCGAFAGRAIFGSDGDLARWVTSILGALLMLSLYRAVFGPRTAY